MTNYTTDVLVVGGGPAGLAAALAARQKGLSVIVADAQSFPIDKACGEGIMPDGMAALRELGVELPVVEGYPFQGIAFTNGSRTAKADFSNGIGVGIRRTRLHTLMAEAAARAGIQLRWSTPVRRRDDGSITLDHERVSAKWIIGADGNSSQVRKWIGLEPKTTSMRIGLRRHYQIAPWNTHVEVHWGDKVQAYVTPIAQDQVCLAFITTRKELRFDHALSLFPHLKERLETATAIGKDRGSVTYCRSLPHVAAGKIALIGEASGAVDAITGEGMMLAFRQATILGQALEKGDLSIYVRQHPHLFRRARVMAKLMLQMSEYSALRKTVLTAFSSAPLLFRGALAFHVGSVAPSFFSDHQRRPSASLQ